MDKLAIHNTDFNGAFIISTNAYVDDRGTFARWFCEKEMNNVLEGQHIVNINYSKQLKKGTIRGMHFQHPPHTESKIVRCIRGKILDVIVDIRRGSPTFLQHRSFLLSEDNMMMLYIPKGFAHGFQSLEDNSEVLYLVTEYHSVESESGLNPLDPRLGIKWPLDVTTISDKDKKREFLNDVFNGLSV